MKTVLFLLFFSFMVFAEDNKISSEQKTFLQDALVATYGQEIVDEYNRQREAQAQIIAEQLPKKILECTFGDRSAMDSDLPPSFRSSVCGDIITAAKEAGISKNQVEGAIAKLHLEMTSERMEALQNSVAHVYSKNGVGKPKLEGLKAEIAAQLPDKFSKCRAIKEEGLLDQLIPDALQEPLCHKLVTDVEKAGFSYAMVKGVLDGLAVESPKIHGVSEKRKPETRAKP